MQETEMRTTMETMADGAAPLVEQTDRDEVLGLMSMALDGLLDAEERARLEAMMENDSELRATWQQWQKMDDLFVAAVHAEPEPGFALRFAARLDARERRAQVRQRWVVGGVAFAAWAATLAALVFCGWMVISSQTQWMNDLVRELVYYPSALGIWLRALRSTLRATFGAGQSLSMLLAYAAAVAVMLSTWMWLLRRTTHEEVVS